MAKITLIGWEAYDHAVDSLAGIFDAYGFHQVPHMICQESVLGAELFQVFLSRLFRMGFNWRPHCELGQDKDWRADGAETVRYGTLDIYSAMPLHCMINIHYIHIRRLRPGYGCNGSSPYRFSMCNAHNPLTNTCISEGYYRTGDWRDIRGDYLEIHDTSPLGEGLADDDDPYSPVPHLKLAQCHYSRTPTNPTQSERTDLCSTKK